MRNAMIAIVVVLFITSLVWAQAQPGEPVQLPDQLSGPTLTPSLSPAPAPQKTTPAVTRPVEPYVGRSDIEATIMACQQGEKVVSGGGQTIVRNHYTTNKTIASGKDMHARQMAKDAGRDAKGDYACGGDGRIARLLKEWRVASLGDVERVVGLRMPAVPPAPTLPVQEPANTPPAPPAEGRGTMPLALEIVGIVLGVGLGVCGLIALCTRANNLANLAGALGNAAQRLQGSERLEFSAGPGCMRLRVEPANATPLQLAPGQGSPVGQALVPVQFAPVTLTLGPAVPSQSQPPAQVVGVRPAAPPAQPAAQQPAAAGPARQRQRRPAAPAQPPAQPPAGP